MAYGFFYTIVNFPLKPFRNKFKHFSIKPLEKLLAFKKIVTSKKFLNKPNSFLFSRLLKPTFMVSYIELAKTLKVPLLRGINSSWTTGLRICTLI